MINISNESFIKYIEAKLIYAEKDMVENPHSYLAARYSKRIDNMITKIENNNFKIPNNILYMLNKLRRYQNTKNLKQRDDFLKLLSRTIETIHETQKTSN